jgi:hypothetical protein
MLLLRALREEAGTSFKVSCTPFFNKPKEVNVPCPHARDQA